MKKLLFWIVLLMLAGWGGFSLWREAKSKWLATKMTGELRAEEEANRVAAALTITRATVVKLEHPNFAGRITPQVLEHFLQEALAKEKENLQVSGVKDLKIGKVKVTSSSQSVLVSAELEGELEAVAVSFIGSLDIELVPAFDGSGLTFIPLNVYPRFQKVAVWSVASDSVLPLLAKSVLQPVARLLIDRISTISIPVTLAGSKPVDLAESLERIDGIDVVDSKVISLRLAIEDLAAQPSNAGVDFVGRAEVVSEAQYQTAREAVDILRERLKDLPGESSCEPCGLSLTAPGQSIACWKDALDCRLGIGKHQALQVAGPIELMVIQEMGLSSNPKDRETFQLLHRLLRPRLDKNPLSGWTPAGTDLLKQVVTGELENRRHQVDPAFQPAAGTSAITIRRDFLAAGLSEVLSQTVLSLNVSIPERSQSIHQTINTGPAPDLNCAANVRGCPSNFDFPGYDPRGCRSDDCRTRNCHDTWFGEVCLDGIDLGCVRDKASCEGTKQREKFEYEGRKAAAHAKWIAEKAACEAQKQLELAGCQLNQAWLTAFQDMDVGKIDGEASFRNGNARVTGLKASIAPDLSTGKVEGQVSGQVHAEASFVFTPLSVGYVVCLAQWGDTVGIDLRVKTVDLGVGLNLETALSEQAALVLKTEPTSATLVFDPPPTTAVLSQAPQVAVVCPVPGAILATLTGLSESAKRTIPIELNLGNEFTVDIPSQEIRIEITPKLFSDLGATGTITAESLIVSRKDSPSP